MDALLLGLTIIVIILAILLSSGIDWLTVFSRLRSMSPSIHVPSRFTKRKLQGKDIGEVTVRRVEELPGGKKIGYAEEYGSNPIPGRLSAENTRPVDPEKFAWGAPGGNMLKRIDEDDPNASVLEIENQNIRKLNTILSLSNRVLQKQSRRDQATREQNMRDIIGPAGDAKKELTPVVINKPYSRGSQTTGTYEDEG